MTEWLDLMLDEVARKRREAEEAKAENERRTKEKEGEPAGKDSAPDQSK